MRAITWLILVLAAAAAIYWFGFYQPHSVSTEVVSDVMVPVPAQVALGQVDDARVANAAADDGNWLTHGRTFDEQRLRTASSYWATKRRDG